MSAALKSSPKPRARTALVAGDVVTDPTIRQSYRVAELIGKGGMGEVWRGACVETGVPCAVKTILLALSDDPKSIVRSQLEAMGLRALRHENVVQVFASGVREDGGIFMVMELLKGESLQELLRVRGKLTLRQAIRLVRDICLGLDTIHQFAIHRDIKPANLHLGFDGVVRLLDLGACKWRQSGHQLTSTGMQLGTILYMSPEQLDESSPLDTRADIWSLGVVLYELLTGKSPFAFEAALPDSKFLIGSRIIGQPHVPLLKRETTAPGWLAQIVDKALAKDPEHRFRSAEEFGRVLTGALEFLQKEQGPCDPVAELVEEMLDRAPTLLPPEPRSAPKPEAPRTPASPPTALSRSDELALALAVTDLVPVRVPYPPSGEYERVTRMPAPSAPWDLSIDAEASADEPAPVSEPPPASGRARVALWVPSWSPAPPAAVAPTLPGKEAPRSAPLAVWQAAPIAPRPRPEPAPRVSPGAAAVKSERRVAAETAATLILIVVGLLVAGYLLFGPELYAWLHATPPVASPAPR